MACLIMKLGIDVKAKDSNFNFKYFIESKEHDSDDIQKNNKNNIQRTAYARVL